jgi:hypothetical protein
MSLELFIIGILVALIIGTNAFWMKLTIDLTNRIMSRNYFEVVQADKQKQKAPDILLPKDNDQDLYATNQAKELNSLIGVT